MNDSRATKPELTRQGWNSNRRFPIDQFQEFAHDSLNMNARPARPARKPRCGGEQVTGRASRFGPLSECLKTFTLKEGHHGNHPTTLPAGSLQLVTSLGRAVAA